MRSRYLIVVDHDGFPADVVERVQPLLPERYDAGDALLFTSEGTPVVPLAAIGGWVVGPLFESSGAKQVVALPSARVDVIATTRGRHLIDHCSGCFVAMWRGPGHQAVSAMRDPSATCPALYWRSGRRILIASDADILAAACFGELAIDWRAVAHHLRYPQLPEARTCISGWRDLLPGEHLTFDADVTTVDQLWKPWTFATSGTALSASRDTLDQLAHVIDSVVSGRSARFERIGLELSGGLDSSILAVALHAVNRSWHGITIATENADGDERYYARLVAERCGSNLLERVVSGLHLDLLAPTVRLTARPTGASYLRTVDRMIASDADATGLDALVSGTGGDNVFCAISSTAPIFDALNALGFSAARHVARNLAFRTESTSWRVGRALATRWLADRLASRSWPAAPRFLSQDFQEPPRQHPWLALPADAAAGTRAHIAGLLRIHAVLDSHDRFADHDVIFPLLDQNVMEACLAIPSWQWLDGGRDRAVARDAFANRLPPEILARRRKGRLLSILVQAYDRSRSGIAELLADGLLAKAGLLDRGAILACLARPAAGEGADFARILDLVDAESWARSIRSRDK